MRLVRAIAILAMALSVHGCTAREQPLIERFFSASRLRDKVALQSFSNVIFEPAGQGIVRSFTIANVSVARTAAGAVTKDVTVVAQVAAPDGRTIGERLVVTLRQVDERQSSYGWMVVNVRGPGDRSAPHW